MGSLLTSTVTYLLPVVAVILRALILAEPITVQLGAGVAIVLAGVAPTRRTPTDKPAGDRRKFAPTWTQCLACAELDHQTAGRPGCRSG